MRQGRPPPGTRRADSDGGHGPRQGLSAGQGLCTMVCTMGRPFHAHMRLFRANGLARVEVRVRLLRRHYKQVRNGRKRKKIKRRKSKEERKSNVLRRNRRKRADLSGSLFITDCSKRSGIYPAPFHDRLFKASRRRRIRALLNRSCSETEARETTARCRPCGGQGHLLPPTLAARLDGDAPQRLSDGDGEQSDGEQRS